MDYKSFPNPPKFRYIDPNKDDDENIFYWYDLLKDLEMRREFERRFNERVDEALSGAEKLDEKIRGDSPYTKKVLFAIGRYRKIIDNMNNQVSNEKMKKDYINRVVSYINDVCDYCEYIF